MSQTDEKVRQVTAQYEREERTRQVQEAKRQPAQQQAAETAKWCNWVDTRIREHFAERIERIEAHLFSDSQGRQPPLHAAIGDVIGKERADRRDETAAAVAETKRWFEGKIETKILPRLEAIEQRLAQHVGQAAGRTEALIETIAAERTARENEIRTAVEEVKHCLAALAERLKTMPGKLPVAKTWRQESITYEGQFVSHEGALWQARKDTAQAPGGTDWISVARAGRDARSPIVRGTFNTREQYRELDVVAFDGATWIARRDDPGLCPGNGWQLMAKQGRTGKPGTPGERGPRGEKGDQGPATMPALVNSKVDENYSLVILRADDSLEVIPLREAFERYYRETGE